MALAQYNSTGAWHIVHVVDGAHGQFSASMPGGAAYRKVTEHICVAA